MQSTDTHTPQEDAVAILTAERDTLQAVLNITTRTAQWQAYRLRDALGISGEMSLEQAVTAMLDVHARTRTSTRLSTKAPNYVGS